MALGGDWKGFRDEIVELHRETTSEEERVALLKAFHELTMVGHDAFDEDTWDQLNPLARTDYLLLLNSEAMEDGVINPRQLDRVTLREVASGRMAADDAFRRLAAAAGEVIGDSANIRAPRRAYGTAIFIVSVVVAIGVGLFTTVSWRALWVIPIGLFVGTLLNGLGEWRVPGEVKKWRVKS
jgi:hypothetical protein